MNWIAGPLSFPLLESIRSLESINDKLIIFSPCDQLTGMLKQQVNALVYCTEKNVIELELNTTDVKRLCVLYIIPIQFPERLFIQQIPVLNQIQQFYNQYAQAIVKTSETIEFRIMSSVHDFKLYKHLQFKVKVNISKPNKQIMYLKYESNAVNNAQKAEEKINILKQIIQPRTLIIVRQQSEMTRITKDIKADTLVASDWYINQIVIMANLKAKSLVTEKQSYLFKNFEQIIIYSVFSDLEVEDIVLGAECPVYSFEKVKFGQLVETFISISNSQQTKHTNVEEVVQLNDLRFQKFINFNAMKVFTPEKQKFVYTTRWDLFKFSDQVLNFILNIYDDNVTKFQQLALRYTLQNEITVIERNEWTGRGKKVGLILFCIEMLVRGHTISLFNTDEILETVLQFGNENGFESKIKICQSLTEIGNYFVAIVKQKPKIKGIAGIILIE
ncbi:Hypothetical_protein [Hexamita inflata]|uniref:Hypothetical_protein n=1 Tax=Hexamita inflata TaxID=28002 RepID=A0AA86QQF4_9EUKA|nr:Hypothetical protein HINF_LOCUS50345 [Hexamita inflata]